MIIIVVISLLSTVDVKTVNQLNGIILQSRCRVKCLIILRRRPKISVSYVIKTYVYIYNIYLNIYQIPKIIFHYVNE